MLFPLICCHCCRCLSCPLVLLVVSICSLSLHCLAPCYSVRSRALHSRSKLGLFTLCALRSLVRLFCVCALSCSCSASALVVAWSSALSFDKFLSHLLCPRVALRCARLLRLAFALCVCSFALRAPRLAGSLYALERRFLSRFLWLALVVLLRSLALLARSDLVLSFLCLSPALLPCVCTTAALRSLCTCCACSA